MNTNPDTSEIITSVKNQKVKDAVGLADRRERDESGLMTIEGIREISHAVKKGIEIKRLFYCIELFSGDDERRIVEWMEKSGAELLPVNSHVFGKLAYREESCGLLAVARQPEMRLAQLSTEGTPLFIILDGAEKPGNLGAVLRSADAAGVDGVIVCGKSTDIYNPNVIRASLGTVFTVPVVRAEFREIVDFLKRKWIRIIAATPHASKEYFDADLTEPCAILMGSEHEGLGSEWLEAADIKVLIPMKGEADSLNLSVSTAIILFEAVRQRRGRLNHGV